MTDIETPEKTSRFAAMVENVKPSNLSEEKKAKVRKATKTLFIVGGTVAATLITVVVTARRLSITDASDENSSESSDQLIETPDNE